ncbi:MAG: hypothetical protein ACR2IN_03285 [Thermoleophilaceae bacterium]
MRPPIGRLGRLRAAPWLWIAERIVRAAKVRWDALPPDDRRELGRLVARSRGRTANLTETERARLRLLVRRFMARGGHV